MEQNRIKTVLRKDFLISGTWPVFMQRCVRNGDVYAHDHDFLEIAFVVRGTGKHLSLHGLEEVHSGDVFVFRPGAWHAYLDCEDLEIINCAFGSELFERELGILMQDTAIGYLLRAGPLSLDRRGILSFHLSQPLLEECLGYLEAMLATVHENKLSGRIAWMGNLLLVLSRLIDSLEDDNRLQEEQIAPLHDAVRNAIQLLEESPAHDWTLREISERAHLDPSHLARLFKSGTGLPPLAYLARLRAEKAASLLLRTDLSIGQIATSVGWSDPSYFALRFKSHFGLTAREYRDRFGPKGKLQGDD